MTMFLKIAVPVMMVSATLLNAQTTAAPPAATSSGTSASPSQSAPTVASTNPPSPAANPKETSGGKQADPLDRESPQSAVVAFLNACHAKNYETARKYLDLRKLKGEERLTGGPQLAQQLEEILERDPQFDVAEVDRHPEGDLSDGLPRDRERIDTFSDNGKTLSVELEHVTLRSGLAVWLFAPDTVALIPRIAQLASDSPIERILPTPLVTWKLLDTPVWRWIGLALLLALAAAVARLLSRLLLTMTEMVLKRVRPQASAEAFGAFLGPFRVLLVVSIFRSGIAWIEPLARGRVFVDRGIALVFFLGLAWLGAAIVEVAVGRIREVLRARHQTFSYSVLPLASRVLKIVILILAVTTILSDWGYNTSTILAGLGVGGLAIALAAQKTVENLFGGVSVISDRPVVIGDTCRFGDKVGTVEDIGLRSTRVRTADRTVVTIPNGQFSSMTLENLSRRDKLLMNFTLNLRRDTTPAQVRTLLASIGRILEDHKQVESGPLSVRFIGVGKYSLDVEIFIYILTQDGDEFLKIQQDLLLLILDAVGAAGTALALPTQASINYPGANTNESAPRELAHQ
jgi:MscS family membrane protein